MRISTVILNVGDKAELASVRHWYDDVIGLRRHSEIPDHSVWFWAGPVVLGLHVGDKSANPSSTCLGFEVDDVDDLFDRLRAQAVEFDGEPIDKSWGARAVSTHDPAGHTVTFATTNKES